QLGVPKQVNNHLEQDNEVRHEKEGRSDQPQKIPEIAHYISPLQFGQAAPKRGRRGDQSDYRKSSGHGSSSEPSRPQRAPDPPQHGSPQNPTEKPGYHPAITSSTTSKFAVVLYA
ncbi:MAG TPA: hypothetical protein PKA43_03820, partial [Candidatus Competibacter phosphatis]|nr:hypothetical protein [Candidatus Competibacter phosphatis]HMR02476.1 hypothetical protein [Candidatus Competibacter phosphatis]